jgi:hypothetical protein
MLLSQVVSPHMVHVSLQYEPFALLQADWAQIGHVFSQQRLNSLQKLMIDSDYPCGFASEVEASIRAGLPALASRGILCINSHRVMDQSLRHRRTFDIN